MSLFVKELGESFRGWIVDHDGKHWRAQRASDGLELSARSLCKLRYWVNQVKLRED